ncbi:YrhB domain-containing protein [Kitasatospora sp. MMS16-BH015]|uniref:YrhB domain-containing protein n=1 Tax=Kitasatospora sp. MMS16-BH015 TaxID=2018025 RepID=UPI000CF2EC5F|nr:YrhB domain-containing protein [Kitasatospora sp. MMS16-BH015]
MISEERAVELVESFLARELPAQRWSGPAPTPEIYHVEERAVGWLVFWRSAEQARARDSRGSFVGGHYLVDRHDGSIHYVPAVWWEDEDWEEQYLLQVKGVRPPDPLAAAVRALVRSAGVVAALSHLRKQAPRLNLQQARAYVTTVQDGAEPPEELASLTRKEPKRPPQPIETLTGPVR